MLEVFCAGKHLLIPVLCISDFHKSSSLVIQDVSSESESDTLIYENIVEIKRKKKKNGTLGGVIHSNVNVEGQAKCLEIHTMF